MAMTKCKECKTAVSSAAKACPNCGISKPGQGRVGVGHVLVLGILVMVLMFAFGTPNTTPTAPAAKAKNNEGQSPEEIAATLLNLNGHLCAEVQSIRRPESRDDLFEVQCVEYRGGKAQKAYMVDAASGKAWPL
ncbi:hypothetical protein [Panacagrimonas sp.]|uniref:hypothetical protein n=1 Tax=Panacagrimonas sp. TaxID=2480088 RepID=UPI003B5297E9